MAASNLVAATLSLDEGTDPLLKRAVTQFLHGCDVPAWAFGADSAQVCTSRKNKDVPEFLNYCGGPACRIGGNLHTLIMCSVLCSTLVAFLFAGCDGGEAVPPLWLYAPLVITAITVAYYEYLCVKDLIVPYVMIAGKPPKKFGIELTKQIGATPWYAMWSLGNFGLTCLKVTSMHTNAFTGVLYLKTICNCSEEDATTVQTCIGGLLILAFVLSQLRNLDVWVYTSHSPKCFFPDAKDFEKSVSIGDAKTSAIDYTIQVPRESDGRASEVRWVTLAKARGWDLWKCTFGERIQFLSWVIGWAGINPMLVDYRFNDMESLAGPHWTEAGLEWGASNWPEDDSESKPYAVDQPVTQEEMKILKEKLLSEDKLKEAIKKGEWFHDGMPELQHRSWQHRVVRRLLMILKAQSRQVIHESLFTSTCQTLIQTIMLLSIPRDPDEGLTSFLMPIMINVGSVALGEVERVRMVFKKTSQTLKTAEELVETFRADLGKPRASDRQSELCSVPMCNCTRNLKHTDGLCERHHEATAFVAEYDECRNLEMRIFMKVSVCAALLVACVAGVVISVRSNPDGFWSSVCFFVTSAVAVVVQLFAA